MQKQNKIDKRDLFECVFPIFKANVEKMKRVKSENLKNLAVLERYLSRITEECKEIDRVTVNRILKKHRASCYLKLLALIKVYDKQDDLLEPFGIKGSAEYLQILHIQKLFLQIYGEVFRAIEKVSVTLLISTLQFQQTEPEDKTRTNIEARGLLVQDESELIWEFCFTLLCSQSSSIIDELTEHRLLFPMDRRKLTRRDRKLLKTQHWLQINKLKLVFFRAFFSLKEESSVMYFFSFLDCDSMVIYLKNTVSYRKMDQHLQRFSWFIMTHFDMILKQAIDRFVIGELQLYYYIVLNHFKKKKESPEDIVMNLEKKKRAPRLSVFPSVQSTIEEIMVKFLNTKFLYPVRDIFYKTILFIHLQQVVIHSNSLLRSFNSEKNVNIVVCLSALQLSGVVFQQESLEKYTIIKYIDKNFTNSLSGYSMLEFELLGMLFLASTLYNEFQVPLVMLTDLEQIKLINHNAHLSKRALKILTALKEYPITFAYRKQEKVMIYLLKMTLTSGMDSSNYDHTCVKNYINGLRGTYHHFIPLRTPS